MRPWYVYQSRATYSFFFFFNAVVADVFSVTPSVYSLPPLWYLPNIGNVTCTIFLFLWYSRCHSIDHGIAHVKGRYGYTIHLNGCLMSASLDVLKYRYTLNCIISLSFIQTSFPCCLLLDSVTRSELPDNDLFYVYVFTKLTWVYIVRHDTKCNSCKVFESNYLGKRAARKANFNDMNSRHAMYITGSPNC
jgi:hypothetical protein